MASHHFLVEPLQGIGPIRFGMHKEDASHAFTYIYHSFFKTPWKRYRSDDCTVVGLIMHYDDSGRVEYIERFPAESSDLTLELYGRDITRVTVRELVEILAAQGHQVEKDDGGYLCREISLSIWNSPSEDDNAPVECLGIGVPGYYDDVPRE